MNFLKKVQNLSLAQRKFILWLLAIVCGVSLFWLWLKYFPPEFNGQGEEFSEQMNMPGLKEEFKNIPQISELKKLFNLYAR